MRLKEAKRLKRKLEKVQSFLQDDKTKVIREHKDKEIEINKKAGSEINIIDTLIHELKGTIKSKQQNHEN